MSIATCVDYDRIYRIMMSTSRLLRAVCMMYTDWGGITSDIEILEVIAAI